MMWFSKSKKRKLSDCIKLEEKKKYIEAIDCFNVYLKDRPQDIAALMGIGNCLGRLNRYDEALKYLQEISKFDPKRESAWTATAAMYAKLGKFDECVECNKTALLLNQYNEIALMGMGVAYLQLKKYDKSVKYFNDVLEINPNNEQVRKYKEMVLSKKSGHKNDKNEIENSDKGESVDKAKLVDNLLEINSKDKDEHFQYLVLKGSLLTEGEKFSDAIKFFNEALELKPDDTEVLIKKAEVLSVVNDFENAHKCFDRAISIDKNDPAFLEKKSMTYFIQKDFKNGLETINDAIKLNPNVGRYWAFKAGFLTSLGGYKEIEIETCISNAFALSPHDSDVKFYIDNLQKFRNKRENK